MWRWLPALLCFLMLGLPWPQPAAAQEATSTPLADSAALAGTNLPATALPLTGSLVSPVDGATLSGQVNLSGTAQAAWQLDFSYQEDPTGAWFRLAQSDAPLTDGVFSVWETTALTDGFYRVRLRVFDAAGPADTLLTVQIRNTLAPTATLTPTPPQLPVLEETPSPSLLAAGATLTLTPGPTPTLGGPLPPNPAALQPEDILVQLGAGALAVTVVFALAGLLLALSRKFRA